jgi:ankyrin repeat protein
VGETVFHVAALNGHLDQLPADLLTEEVMLRRTRAGDTVIHAAAIAGHLGQIPPAFLTHDHLTLRASGYHNPRRRRNGATASHIPRAQFTRDLLLVNNDHGDTPLHAAAFEGHLDQIPAELLDAEVLGKRNYDGVTPLRTAMRRGHVEQLPEALRPRPIGPLRRLLMTWGLLARPRY